MEEWHLKYQVDVPEGKAGDWAVEKFAVTAEAEKWEQLRAMMNRGRYVPVGTYTGLYRKNKTIMSDTPDEIRDHLGAIRMANGQVLINGLGLGVMLKAVLAKPEVAHVTVVEKASEVIGLVGTHYACLHKSRLTIVHDDAFTYKPPKGIRYGAVWHDIWDDLCADNLPEMSNLHRKYGKRCDWQGSWGKDWIKAWTR